MREKEAKAAEKAAKAPPKKETAKKENEEDLDPAKYTENRRQQIQNIRDSGQNPYPHKYAPCDNMLTVKELREKYDNDKLGNGQYDENTLVGVRGRAMAIREQGKKLVFIDLVE